MHQHTDIGGTSAVWHFHAGQNTGQLLCAARRVFSRDDANVQIAFVTQCLFQRGNRLWFIIFNTNQNPLSLQHPCENATAFQHFGGVILHQTIVRGDVGLALGRINNQGFHPAQAAFEFGGGREARATQARNAGVVNTLHNVGARMLTVVRQRIKRYPAVVAVGRQKNTQF